MSSLQDHAPTGTPSAEHAAHHHEPPRTGNTLTRFVRNSPFLCASLVLHVVVLLILAFVTATYVPKDPQKIKVPPVVMQTVIDDPRPPKPQRKFSKGSVDDAPGPIATEPSTDERYEDARGKAGPTSIETPALGLIPSLAADGKGGKAFDDRIDDVSNDTFTPSKRDPLGVLLAATIRNATMHKTLVVLLVDRSPSVLCRDLKPFSKKMDYYFREISNNASVYVRRNAKWAVVSYGKDAEIKCGPTTRVSAVKHALWDVNPDLSGEENIGKAIQTALDSFAKGGQERILMATITDEVGDDIVGHKALEDTITRLKDARAEFYVLGHEAAFCTPKKRVSFPASRLVGKSRDEYQAYADGIGKKLENIMIRGWAHAGPECPLPELWWSTNWHGWYHWGGRLHNIASGFGMYALQRMASATDGRYLMLKRDSNQYDIDKLEAGYMPDYCSRKAYVERVKDNGLCRTLHETWDELGKVHFSHDLRNREKVARVLRDSRVARRYCFKRARELERLAAGRQAQALWNAGRWQAHADVTVAELYRLRFMLGQYHDALNEGWIKAGRTIPRGKRLLLRRGKVPDDYKGKDAARHEYDVARSHIKMAIENHADTPWEVVARRQLRGIHPWRVSLTDVPRVPDDKNRIKPPPIAKGNPF